MVDLLSLPEVSIRTLPKVRKVAISDIRRAPGSGLEARMVSTRTQTFNNILQEFADDPEIVESFFGKAAEIAFDGEPDSPRKNMMRFAHEYHTGGTNAIFKDPNFDEWGVPIRIGLSTSAGRTEYATASMYGVYQAKREESGRVGFDGIAKVITNGSEEVLVPVKVYPGQYEPTVWLDTERILSEEKFVTDK